MNDLLSTLIGENYFFLYYAVVTSAAIAIFLFACLMSRLQWR